MLAEQAEQIGAGCILVDLMDGTPKPAHTASFSINYKARGRYPISGTAHMAFCDLCLINVAADTPSVDLD